MKIVILALAISSFVLASCGDNSKPESSESHENMSTNAPVEAASQSVSPIKDIVQHYLHVKNALAADNGTEAASGAKAITQSIAAVDQSKFTAQQKATFTDVVDDLKEQAEHTAANASNITHQREHFIAMSKDVHDLIKSFGTTQTLYLDHCPMADNNKGANWISETEDIKNPYMGKKMPKCGSMEEVIKQ